MDGAISNDTYSRDGRSSPFLTFKLSWVAYISETWWFLIRGMIFSVIALGVVKILNLGSSKPEQNWIMLLAVLLTFVQTAYSVMLTRSIALYTDETGVWLYSGVFPWQKGITGVKWRDVGEASYKQGIMPWMTRSYSIWVSHRFSKDSELAIKHLHRGNLAVEHINGLLTSVSARMERP